MPKGILKNKLDPTLSPPPSASTTTLEPLDRQQVIRNTRLNAQIAAENSSRGNEIRAKISQQKRRPLFDEQPEVIQAEEHLKWDEINLYKTEQEKAATMKIDEPKTPYEGGFNPEGEYYQDDDDDAEGKNDDIDDIPAFELGESEFIDDVKRQGLSGSLHGGEVVKGEQGDEDEEDEEEEGEQEPLTAEERHKRFEEMRKAHYHMKGAVLHHQIDIPDDDDEDEADDNNDKDNQVDDENDDSDNDQPTRTT